MSDKNSKNAESPDRGSATEYLHRIKTWQRENGGFRRVPPRAFDEKLNNWLQRCRYDFRNGALSPQVGDELIALGLLNHSKNPEPQDQQSDYDRATWAICAMKRMGAENRNGPSGDELRADPSLAKWLDDIKQLAWTNPHSMLLGDLRWMMPRIFSMEIEPFMGEVRDFKVDRRSGEDMIDETFKFIKRRGRLPDLLSKEVRERKMANWLIRMETGFEPTNWARLAEKPGNAAAVERILQALQNTSEKQRNAQWRWWSSVAMEVMRNPKPGSRWQDRLHTEEPEAHAEQLGLAFAAVKSGKPGWQGGAWGVDPICVGIAAGKASNDWGDGKRVNSRLERPQ